MTCKMAKNQKGFSILIIPVVIGFLVSTAILAMRNINHHSHEILSEQIMQSEVSKIKDTVFHTLRQKDVCTANFGGRSLSSVASPPQYSELDNFYLPRASNLKSPGKLFLRKGDLAGGGFPFNQYKIIRIRAFLTDQIAPQSFFGNFEVELHLINNPEKIFGFTIPAYVTASSGGTHITGCHSTLLVDKALTHEDTLCRLNKGTNQIFDSRLERCIPGVVSIIQARRIASSRIQELSRFAP